MRLTQKGVQLIGSDSNGEVAMNLFSEESQSIVSYNFSSAELSDGNFYASYFWSKENGRYTSIVTYIFAIFFCLFIFYLFYDKDMWRSKKLRKSQIHGWKKELRRARALVRNQNQIYFQCQKSPLQLGFPYLTNYPTKRSIKAKTTMSLSN